MKISNPAPFCLEEAFNNHAMVFRHPRSKYEGSFVLHPILQTFAFFGQYTSINNVAMCCVRRAFISSYSSAKKRLEVMYYKAILFSFQGLYKRPTHCFIRVDPKQLLSSSFLRPLFTRFERHTFGLNTTLNKCQLLASYSKGINNE